MSTSARPSVTGLPISSVISAANSAGAASAPRRHCACARRVPQVDPAPVAVRGVAALDDRGGLVGRVTVVRPPAASVAGLVVSSGVVSHRCSSRFPVAGRGAAGGSSCEREAGAPRARLRLHLGREARPPAALVQRSQHVAYLHAERGVAIAQAAASERVSSASPCLASARPDSCVDQSFRPSAGKSVRPRPEVSGAEGHRCEPVRPVQPGDWRTALGGTLVAPSAIWRP